MLQVVTGALYSDLEDALAEHLLSFRSKSPLASLAIAVPSEYVRFRLQWALCAERGLPLFNVHILTFFQLAVRVLEEQGYSMTQAFRSEHFFREWIHQILNRRKITREDLAELSDVPGAWGALWRTIKDLKNGSVDAEFALEILKQTRQEHDPVCQSVMSLYAGYCREQSHIQAFDGDDAARLACPGVGSSTFLVQQEHIWYYGFYDLTQIQLDLFHAIAQAYPTSMFFPLVRNHPAYAFAQQFFDRHILGLSTGRIQTHSGFGKRSALQGLFTHPGGDDRYSVSLGPAHKAEDTHALSTMPPSGKEQESLPTQENFMPKCQIIEVAGVEDEIAVVAKDILRQREERQTAWHDIGVVGRTLMGYEQILPRVFQEHGIPFNTSLSRPMMEFPYVQAFLRLLMIPVSDFRRDHIMDVLTSPYLQWSPHWQKGEMPQPELWDRASRRLGVTKGLSEWERFVRMIKNESRRKGTRQKVPTSEAMSQGQVEACEKTLNQIVEAVKRIPSSATYDVFVDRVMTLVEEFLMPPWRENRQTETRASVWEHLEHHEEHHMAGHVLSEAVRNQMEEIRCLTQVSDDVSFSEFVETVERFMRGVSVPLQPPSSIIDGVWVLDAMAARGFSFRTLYLVGLNEHVFPRHIQEDAFLRDSVRRFLYLHVGCKVPEKSSGYEEEQLLFYLLVNAATEAVTLLTQRFEQDDRSGVPSWYVSEVQRCLGEVPVMTVPKRGSVKCQALPLFADRWFTPQEKRIQWMVDRVFPREPVKRDTMGWSVIQRGIATLAGQESCSPRLNRFDGMTGILTPYWKDMQTMGVSPTTIEQYAECPFKFFAKHVLRLERVEWTDCRSWMGPREIGNLLHHLLKECGEHFAERNGLPSSTALGPSEMVEIVKAVADPIFQNYERHYPTGYPLVWDLQQEQLVQMVSQVLKEDLDFQDGDWKPLAFEEGVRGEVTTMREASSYQIPLVGRVDRVDWSDSQQQFRIVDYKYKKSVRTIPSEKNLTRDIVRGLQLQPPLYLKVAEEKHLWVQNIPNEASLGNPGYAGVWLYYLTPTLSGDAGLVTRVSFSQKTWRSLKPQVDKTVTTLLSGIQQGEYFMVPGSHCQMCDYRSICHRTHPMSRWRAMADRVQTQPYRDIRYATPTLSSESRKTAFEP